MKRNYIVKLFAALLLVLIFGSCGTKEDNKTATHKQDESKHQYTCPMHPQVLMDEPGTCPICKMELVLKTVEASRRSADTSLSYLLKPVNEQVVASVPVIKASKGSKIYTAKVQGRITYDTRNQTSISSRVSGRIERLYIKYNYQPVMKGQLIMEIYSPDLAAAQRELLFISRTGDEENMLQSAKQRLQLLGMTEQQIASVLRTGKISYSVPVYSNASGYILEQTAPASPSPTPISSGSPSTGGGMANMSGSSSVVSAASTPSESTSPSSPMLIREGQYVSSGQTIFTIYRTGGLVAEFSLNPQIASHMKRNSKLVINSLSDPGTSISGNIGLIQPVFNPGENFTVARVYLQNKNFRAGELVLGHVPMVTRNSTWLPAEAVMSLGNKSVVFKKEGRVFVPREITVGITANNEVQIITGISSWEIAKNAYFMIDSESFIKVQNKQ